MSKEYINIPKVKFKFTYIVKNTTQTDLTQTGHNPSRQNPDRHNLDRDITLIKTQSR